ncbi:ABC transporter ATP-binding protein [Planctomycetota bacterium]|nr:ABC transporter ATP-binding protein [Planctomycetota bacterium]
MTNEEVVIEVLDASKSYAGDIQAVRDVSLTVTIGEMVAIMGKSGSGKSTLLNLIGSLDTPDSGKILVNGHDISTLSNIPEFRRNEIGFIFQLHNLLSHLTLLDNVSLPLAGVSGAKERAKVALTEVGLGERLHHRPTTVSGGERQRAAIARAIVNQPKVLLADEPTGNVDTEIEEQLLDLFDELRSRHKMTILVVTHDEAVARRADRIVHYRNGQIERVESKNTKNVET